MEGRRITTALLLSALAASDYMDMRSSSAQEPVSTEEYFHNPIYDYESVFDTELMRELTGHVSAYAIENEQVVAIANGIIKDGRFYTVRHVAEVITHIEVGDELFEVNFDLVDLTKQQEENYLSGDQVVSIPVPEGVPADFGAKLPFSEAMLDPFVDGVPVGEDFYLWVEDNRGGYRRTLVTMMSYDSNYYKFNTIVGGSLYPCFGDSGSPAVYFRPDARSPEGGRWRSLVL